jgi:hypothetical protein
MAAPYPQTLPQAFATGAAGPDRNVIPDAPVTTQRASWQLGFPPLTMAPVAAGGKPMLGPDMNGTLYMLSTHTYYQQSGKLYLWNADVVVSIGGYAVGTLLGSTDGLTVWYNLTAANASDPDAGGGGWLAWFSYGMAPVAGLAGGIRVLTTAEYAKSVLVLTGVLAANQQVVLPTQLRRWLVVNACTGAFSLTVKTAASAGVAVPQGGFAAPVEVYGDGVNIYNVVAPVNLPIDQAATPLTIVQRTNVADVFARYFNSNGGADNYPIIYVFYDVGDGYLRKMSLANFKLQVAPNKIASGRIIGGVLQAGSVGVTSITPAGTGTFNIDVTAAGFTTPPSGTGSIDVAGANPDTVVALTLSNTSVQMRTVFGAVPVSRNFNFVIAGV